MHTVYNAGDYKVVVVSATYAVIRKADGKVLYKTDTVGDAIDTADEIQECTSTVAA